MTGEVVFHQISHQTSYQSKDYKSISSEKEIPQEPVFNKYIQKFRRESEIKEFEFKKRKFKRGTLESHSFTDLNQPILSDYYFGVTIGSMHQGNEILAYLFHIQGGYFLRTALKDKLRISLFIRNIEKHIFLYILLYIYFISSGMFSEP